VGAFYAVGVGLMALLSTISTFGSGRWPLGVVIALFGVGLVGYGGLVLWRVGVELHDDRLILRGPLGTQVVPIAEVDRFEIGQRWPWRAWLVKRDGSILRTTGLGASGVQHRKSLDQTRRLVATLNELLEQRR